MISRPVIFAVTLSALLPAVAVAKPVAPAAFATYCFECHGPKTQEAELDLHGILSAADANRAGHAKSLQHALEAIEDRSMPPRKARAKPSNDERAQMATWLRTEIRRLSETRRDDPGHVVMARLNPLEYRNVLRDLSGGALTTAGQYLPNEGGAGEGFANVGEAQGMNAAILEKYIEAAKLSLQHLRVSPVLGAVWQAHPQSPSAEPAAAREEAIRHIIEWHVAQQQKWNELHQAELKSRLGFVHAAYFDAAWQYHHRKALGQPTVTLADVAARYEVRLAPVVLEKWLAILSAQPPEAPFVDWATAWQKLPPPGQINPTKLREACIAIERGSGGQADERLDFAPDYERSWHDPKHRKAVEESAVKGVWPFSIEIGDARELYLVMTTAGETRATPDGTWRNGRFVFADGTSRPWQDAARVVGASSGKPFAFGRSHDGDELPGDSIGVKPPGALKLELPTGAVRFEVEAAVAHKDGRRAIAQALVLREKPRAGSGSFYPGRMIFGTGVFMTSRAPAVAPNRDRERALRRRNIAEANRTKIGLNAERNVLADWTQTPIDFIGGPWPTHDADKADPLAPYHLTVEQVRRNASPEDLAELQKLYAHLASVAQVPEQSLLRLMRQVDRTDTKEGVPPAAAQLELLSPADRATAHRLLAEVAESEARHLPKVRQFVTDFARRAWRRSITPREQDRLLELFTDARRRGLSFDEAVKTPLLVVLVSPQFLYRHPTGSTTDLTSHDLASRLSFMLWGSIPDEELLALAEKDQLRDRDVLRQQARRMLRDDKARAMTELFAGQMFAFRDFESFSGPDPKRFPEFTPVLRRAMLAEATTFVDYVLRGDRPLTDLVAADYTFVNEPLARHYGIAGISGDAMQKVAAPPGRGGLTGMAMMLTQRSLPLRTSPVQRGVWVLEDLLGVHLPNPPPVPPLPDDETNEAGVPVRRLLELHRANAACASCHDKIDPLGVALEHFDPIGRWREADRAGQPLSAQARTFDGVDLNGSRGLQQYLLTRKDQFLRHFSRKLLGYALGRAVEVGDAALLDRMHNRVAAEGQYRFEHLVDEIIASPQFRTRRVDKQPGERQPNAQ